MKNEKLKKKKETRNLKQEVQNNYSQELKKIEKRNPEIKS